MERNTEKETNKMQNIRDIIKGINKDLLKGDN